MSPFAFLFAHMFLGKRLIGFGFVKQAVKEKENDLNSN